MFDLAVSILIRTPWWVWLILVVTLLFGVWSLRPHTVSPRRLLIVPLIAAGLSLWNASTTLALPAQTMVVWATCFFVGCIAGVLWTKSMQVKIDRATGKIGLPGTRIWLVVGLLFFISRYALGVFLAFHRQPEFDMLRSLAPNALGGLAAGLVLGWACGIVRRYQAVPVRAML